MIGGMAKDEYITVKEAAERLGVTRFVMSRAIRDEGLRVLEQPLDKRVKWLRVADVDALKKLRDPK